MTRPGLDELKASILNAGLYHAPMCWYDADTGEWVLVTGERRLTVIKEIHAEDQFFLYDARLFPPGEMPIIELSEPTEENIVVAEAEENLIREDLPWIDRTRALAAIHEVRQRANPKQTAKETATELTAKGVKVGGAQKASSLASKISQARIVAEHLDDPIIAGSRNENEAYQRILRRDEEAASALLHRAVMSDTSRLTCNLIHGDAAEVMQTMPDAQFDLILTDPPYGIGADSAGYRSKSSQIHEYDDSPNAAEKIIQAILLEGWRLAKTRANLLMFTDINRWEFVRDAASRIGWDPFRTAIIWNKSMSEGMNPWGSQGPNRTHEIIFYATKGQRGMLKSIPDVLFHPRVPQSVKVFAAQKPFSLLRQLIEVTTIAGDHIFDPCAGSGATLRAARLLGRPSTGIEKAEATYNTALSFIQKDKEDSEVNAERSVDDL